MKCPCCRIELEAIRYESFPVQRCPSCSGFLVSGHRVSSIKRRVNKDIELLQQQASEERGIDSQNLLKCPRCRNRMEKVRLHQLDFFVDQCGSCDYSWFDSGELAKIQLKHEELAATQELQKMRDRSENMSPEEKAEYKRQIANLPEHENFIKQGLVETFLRVARIYWS